MKPVFFPRDATFWKYHLTALFVLASIQALIIIFFQGDKLFNTVAGIVWLLFFTAGSLFFRYYFKRRDRHHISIAKMIPLIFIFSLVMGVLITLGELLLTVPFFWSDLLNHPDVVANQVTPNKLLLHMMIGNSLQSQLFLSVWIFIYISIANSRRVREAELTNLRLQNSLKEAQLANLNNQLNPHFLFNALNNIRFTIHKNPDKADTMLTALSDMLRYSLETSRKDKVCFSDELEIVERYISLMKVQMGDRLEVAITIEKDVTECLIPPMILQLLIENAVKHGIDKLRHGGSIELKGGLSDQYLILSVRNTRGENKPLLGELLSAGNTGIGLANIQSRLKLLYGDHASLEIDETDDYFCVTLTLPRE